MAQTVIAVIGAGGKTTAMRCIAKQQAHKSVLVTTTTHIFPMSLQDCRRCLIDPEPETLAATLDFPGVVCAGSAAKEGKLGPLPEESLRCGIHGADLVIYEADGSRRLPLKLHRQDEPVLIPGTDRCLVIAGLSAVGRPVGEVVHRYPLEPSWRDAPHKIVGKEELQHCVLESVAASGFPVSGIRIFLNQRDALENPQVAREVAEVLSGRGFSVKVGSLDKDAAGLYDWIAE